MPNCACAVRRNADETSGQGRIGAVVNPTRRAQNGAEERVAITADGEPDRLQQRDTCAIGCDWRWLLTLCVTHAVSPGVGTLETARPTRAQWSISTALERSACSAAWRRIDQGVGKFHRLGHGHDRVFLLGSENATSPVSVCKLRLDELCFELGDARAGEVQFAVQLQDLVGVGGPRGLRRRQPKAFAQLIDLERGAVLCRLLPKLGELDPLAQALTLGGQGGELSVAFGQCVFEVVAIESARRRRRLE